MNEETFNISLRKFLKMVGVGSQREIERLAAAELRSANAQVEYLLREALKGRGVSSRPAAVKPTPKATP